MTGSERDIRRRLAEEKRCPLCSTVQDREFDIISRLQYRVTHSGRLRRALAAEGGFCDFHFRQFRKLANSETNALLMIAFIKSYGRHGNWPSAKCRICRELEIFERDMVRQMARLLRSDSFQELYQKSAGLCLLHMGAVWRHRSARDLRKWLNDTQISQMEASLPQLKAMSSHSFFATSGGERASIALAVEKFVGRKAIGL